MKLYIRTFTQERIEKIVLAIAHQAHDGLFNGRILYRGLEVNYGKTDALTLVFKYIFRDMMRKMDPDTRIGFDIEDEEDYCLLKLTYENTPVNK